MTDQSESHLSDEMSQAEKLETSEDVDTTNVDSPDNQNNGK